MYGLGGGGGRGWGGGAAAPQNLSNSDFLGQQEKFGQMSFNMFYELI